MQPKCGQSGYITPTVSGVPNTPGEDKNGNRLCSPHEEKVGTSPLPAQGSPTLMAGTKMRNAYAAQMWTKWLHHPCRLRGPGCSAQGEKAKMAMQPKCGQSGYITPAVSGIPNA